jgi:hypothetical protein
MEMIRKMPYPCHALVSICNDLDGLEWSDFLDIHRFLNTREETVHGPGLDLDIGDSFWFFSSRPDINDSFTYFDGLASSQTKYAPAIRQLVQLGYLDVLHSWGNFSQSGGFERRHAELAAEEIAKWQQGPLVWTDHGEIHNLQNLAALGDRPFLSDGTGKRQKVLEYHADVMVHAGIAFVWRTTDVAQIFGHERVVPRRERITHLNRGVSGARKLVNVARTLVSGGRYSPMIHPLGLRDGQEVWRFERYLPDWSRTTLEDLGDILQPAALDGLEENKGAVCLLTHFGFGRRFSELPPKTLSALRLLADRCAKGQIAVLSTSRLLLYLYARDHLSIESIPHRSPRTYRLGWPAGTPRSILRKGAEAFNHLTFYTDDPEGCIVEYEGRSLPTHINPPDETARRSVTIRTWQRPDFPFADLSSV